jgi:transposase-like protein
MRTYVGGKPRYRGNSKRGRSGLDSNKTPVVALVERGSGRVRAFPVMRVTAQNLGKAIEAQVAHNATLMTDEFSAYKAVAEDLERKHVVVNHSKSEYVRGEAHTNTVEGFFSLLKRGINGTFHHVSREHLSRYCDEFAFRYENRKTTDGTRAGLLVKGAEGKRLTYKQPAGLSA